MTKQTVDPGREAPYRPLLNPALRRLWRGRSSMQLGVDPSRALVVEDLDTTLARLLLELDGSRTEGEVIADAAADGLDVGTVAHLLSTLRWGDALLDADPARVRCRPPADPGSATRLPGRLGPDVAALSLWAGERSAADQFGQRLAARVVVRGSGRIAVPLAALIAAAGVPRVSVVGVGTVEPTDTAPGGLSCSDIARPVGAAAAEALRRVAPEIDPTPPGPDDTIDLMVIAAGAPIDSDLRDALHRSALPHLLVGIRETTAIIGPLVVPGLSSCTRCADLHRADRDPAWPLVAAQLAGRSRLHVPPCDVALAAIAAGLGAMQALTFLGGVDLPHSLGTTLELPAPWTQVRRRSWPIHPGCECTDPATDATPGFDGDATNQTAGPPLPRAG